MTPRLLMLLPLPTLKISQGKMLSVSPQCCQLERVETKYISSLCINNWSKFKRSSLIGPERIHKPSIPPSLWLPVKNKASVKQKLHYLERKVYNGLITDVLWSQSKTKMDAKKQSVSIPVPLK